MARRMPQGSKRYSRILVTEDDGNTLTISSHVFEVQNSAGTVIQTSAAASLRNNGTAAVEVYGLVDTTAAGFVDGEWVKCKFTYTIDDVVVDIQYDPILLAEDRL